MVRARFMRSGRELLPSPAATSLAILVALTMAAASSIQSSPLWSRRVRGTGRAAFSAP
jgi:uncharacterized paraquat-inducible protein A